MPVPNPPSSVDLSGVPMLLGDPGDVTVLDGRARPAEVTAAGVASACGTVPVGVRLDDLDAIGAAVDAGAALIHVPAAMIDLDAVRAAAVGGVAVVVAGDFATARSSALALVEAGAPPGRLVLEVPVAPDPGAPAPNQLQVDEVHHLGASIGAVLVPGVGPTDEVEGWEVAMLTHLLQLGVRTVRNVPLARFRRVAAVVEALRGERGHR